MKPRSLFFALFCFLLVGCDADGLTAVKAEVHVEIVNRSSQMLQNAKAIFGDYECEWGVVGKTFSKDYGFYPKPITPQAELQWDENGKARSEKIDLRKIYPPGKSGRLTFTVYDGRVEASFKAK
jgi:hypothetical protein